MKGFVALPIEIYQPNAELDRLEVNYEKDYHVEDLKVKLDLIGMYKGIGDITNVWLAGNEQAHEVMLTEQEFEIRYQQAIEEYNR